MLHDKCYKASRLTPGCTAIADLPYVLVYDHTCDNQQANCSGNAVRLEGTATEHVEDEHVVQIHIYATSSYVNY